MWAQRKNLVSLTINVEDCKNPEIKIEPTKVFFKGTGGPDKKSYEVTIELFGEINTEVWPIHLLKVNHLLNFSIFLFYHLRNPSTLWEKGA